MSVRARLLATVPALITSPGAGPPRITGRSGRRMVVHRSDEELVAQELDDAFAPRPGTLVRFPAPWRRFRSGVAVAPDRSAAVFAGTHAVRAVEPSGTVRWEVRHGCWADSCRESHESREEYTDRRDHQFPGNGSVAFSADGSLVWAHIRGTLTGAGPLPDAVDEWLLLDPADGRVLARTDLRAAASGSRHLPHPLDPHRMHLGIGEGQDGTAARRGRWDGTRLEVAHLEDELLPLDVSASGARLMTVSHEQDELAVRDPRGAVVDGLTWDAVDTIPRHGGAPHGDEAEMPTCWDWSGGFLDETTLIVSTIDCDDEWGEGRQWLVDIAGARGLTRIDYPLPISSHAPAALGDGAWCTTSESVDALYVWVRDNAEDRPGS